MFRRGSQVVNSPRSDLMSSCGSLNTQVRWMSQRNPIAAREVVFHGYGPLNKHWAILGGQGGFGVF